MRRSSLLVAALGFALAVEAPAFADEFTLKDGEVVDGTIVGSSDTSYFLRLSDGSRRVLAKDDVAKRIEGGSQEPVRNGAGNATFAFGEGVGALKKAAKDGLAARARVGDATLATYVPLRAENNQFAMSPRPQTVELETATYQDKQVDDIALAMWKQRGVSGEDRYRALKSVMGCVGWVEADVLSTATERGETDATIEYRSTVMRARAKVRVTGRGVKKGDVFKIPVIFLLRKDEGGEFLSAASGDTLSRWPFDCVPLMAEVALPVETSAGDAAFRTNERNLDARVHEWLRGRMTMHCQYCKGTRRIRCDNCEGKGWWEKIYFDVSGQDSQMVKETCPRCTGKGSRECSCKDGYCEQKLNDALKNYGWYARPITSFLSAGVVAKIQGDGKQATVTCYVRYAAHEEPVIEKTTWKLDAKGVWKPEPSDVTQGAKAAAPAPKTPPRTAGGAAGTPEQPQPQQPRIGYEFPY